MVYVQKRISVGMEVIQFFTMRKWNFRSDNMDRLANLQSPEESEIFKFDSKNNGEEYEYIKNAYLGARQYTMKDPLTTIPKARIQLKMYVSLFYD
jgi:alcohol-forming fatty acyl-CoA reductase